MKCSCGLKWMLNCAFVCVTNKALNWMSRKKIWCFWAPQKRFGYDATALYLVFVYTPLGMRGNCGRYTVEWIIIYASGKASRHFMKFSLIGINMKKQKKRGDDDVGGGGNDDDNDDTCTSYKIFKVLSVTNGGCFMPKQTERHAAAMHVFRGAKMVAPPPRCEFYHNSLHLIYSFQFTSCAKRACRCPLWLIAFTSKRIHLICSQVYLYTSFMVCMAGRQLLLACMRSGLSFIYPLDNSFISHRWKERESSARSHFLRIYFQIWQALTKLMPPDKCALEMKRTRSQMICWKMGISSWNNLARGLPSLAHSNGISRMSAPCSYLCKR